MTKNLVIFNKMLKDYERFSYTNNYIWGFAYKKVIYMAFTDAQMLPFICCQDIASRDAGYSIRFKPTTAQKLLLMPYAMPLCSEEFFEAEVANCKYNRGEIFEKMITELYGQKWTKDHVPFYKAPDLTANGIDYQIKFNKATFCNEQTLINIEKNI